MEAGRLSFFVFKTGYNGNYEHSDLYKIIPCDVFHITTSPLTEEGKKITLPPKKEEATAPFWYSYGHNAVFIITRKIVFVKE